MNGCDRVERENRLGLALGLNYCYGKMFLLQSTTNMNLNENNVERVLHIDGESRLHVNNGKIKDLPHRI